MLTSLDLSFNQITVIDGLEQLTQLEDLSLYANEVSKVQNLEKLTKLACLSLGKNKVDQLGDSYTCWACAKERDRCKFPPTPCRNCSTPVCCMQLGGMCGKCFTVRHDVL